MLTKRRCGVSLWGKSRQKPTGRWSSLNCFTCTDKQTMLGASAAHGKCINLRCDQLYGLAIAEAAERLVYNSTHGKEKRTKKCANSGLAHRSVSSV